MVVSFRSRGIKSRYAQADPDIHVKLKKKKKLKDDHGAANEKEKKTWKVLIMII
jgi:hypothetical protein